MPIEAHKLKLHTKFAKYFDLYFGKDYEKGVEVIHWIVQKFSKGTPTSLLDLMCGTGAHIWGLSKKGYQRIVGLDASEEMVQLAKKRLKNLQNVKIILRNVRDLDYAEEFDVVYCWFNSMQYFFTDEELKMVLYRVHAALRKDGLFIADLRNPTSFFSFLSKFKDELPKAYTVTEGDTQVLNWVHDITYDENTHIATYHTEFVLKNLEGTLREDENHSYRLMERREFEVFLKQCGFVTGMVYGSSTEIDVPFDEVKSDKMVFVS